MIMRLSRHVLHITYAVDFQKKKEKKTTTVVGEVFECMCARLCAHVYMQRHTVVNSVLFSAQFFFPPNSLSIPYTLKSLTICIFFNLVTFSSYYFSSCAYCLLNIEII